MRAGGGNSSWCERRNVGSSAVGGSVASGATTGGVSSGPTKRGVSSGASKRGIGSGVLRRGVGSVAVRGGVGSVVVRRGTVSVGVQHGAGCVTVRYVGCGAWHRPGFRYNGTRPLERSLLRALARRRPHRLRPRLNDLHLHRRPCRSRARRWHERRRDEDARVPDDGHANCQRQLSRERHLESRRQAHAGRHGLDGMLVRVVDRRRL